MNLVLDVDVDVEAARGMLIQCVFNERLFGELSADAAVAKVTGLSTSPDKVVCERLFDLVFSPGLVKWSIRNENDDGGKEQDAA